MAVFDYFDLVRTGVLAADNSNGNGQQRSGSVGTPANWGFPGTTDTVKAEAGPGWVVLSCIVLIVGVLWIRRQKSGDDRVIVYDENYAKYDSSRVQRIQELEAQNAELNAKIHQNQDEMWKAIVKDRELLAACQGKQLDYQAEIKALKVENEALKKENLTYQFDANEAKGCLAVVRAELAFLKKDQNDA